MNTPEGLNYPGPVDEIVGDDYIEWMALNEGYTGPNRMDQITSDPELNAQLERVESYRVRNMVDFWSPEATEDLTRQIAKANARLAIAMHPYYFPWYSDDASAIMGRMVNNANPRIPPLLIIEGLFTVQSTDEAVESFVKPHGRSVYYARSMDKIGSPLPAQITARRLVDRNLVTVSTKGADRKKLEFYNNDVLWQSTLKLAEIGANEFADRLNALGVKTVIIGGSNLELREISEKLLNNPDDSLADIDKIREYLELRKKVGAKKMILPQQCVGMLMRSLSQRFDVKLSNFTRNKNRTDLEEAEGTL